MDLAGQRGNEHETEPAHPALVSVVSPGSATAAKGSWRPRVLVEQPDTPGRHVEDEVRRGLAVLSVTMRLRMVNTLRLAA